MSKSPDTFVHRGYVGSIEFSHDDECLVGKILHIDDLVMYDASTYSALKKAFHKAVDGYLTACEKIGKEPQKSYSGNLNVRIGASVHSAAARAAQQENIALNEYIRGAVEARNVATLRADIGLAQQALRPILRAVTTSQSVTVEASVGRQTASTSAGTLRIVQ